MAPLGLLFALLGTLRIVAADCPSAQQIVDRWYELRAGSPTGEAYISVTDGQLRVVLLDPDGSITADRRLKAPESCDERARIVAVVLAAWTPPPAPAGSRTTTAVIHPPSTTPESSETSLRPGRRLAVELSGELLGQLSPAGFAPGGALGVSLAAPDELWWGHVGLTAGGLRTIALPRGRANYDRFWLSLGPRLQLRPRRMLQIDLTAELALALVYVAGEGFPVNSSAYHFDLGWGGGLRVGWRTARVTPYVSASVIGWLTEQKLVEQSLAGQGSASLPRIDGLFSLGIAIEP